MRRPIKTRKSQAGIAIVETVIVSPLLLFLLLLGAEVTNAWIEHNTLTKAARIAVRHLASEALNGTTGVVYLAPGLVAETRNLVVFGNAAGTGSPVLQGLTVANVQVLDLGATNIQVNVSYAYTGILGDTLPNFGIGADSNLALNLRASVSMRAL